jgi:predicted nucleic acid-binding protein
VPQPTLILDACVVLNLLASDEVENILGVGARKFLICDAVAREVMCLRADGLDADAFEMIRVDCLVTAGVLKICSLESPLEESLYVNYAGLVGDGEAMSIAIAEARGYSIATDDRKARRVASEALLDVRRLFFTSDFIRQWADETMIADERLKTALLKIRKRASFFPPKSDPNFHWWMNLMNS